ncbi:MAG: bifunctional proline dehydrogenase/L-glutamate gamma-semialdehyde dehydrogenase [Bdellovibrionaceae bacterium]|nr:bifunctional proline dehydrogenase/L-glutamate gamma-semialdehyde dehydrogenase [Pseudobdellovibrionaceae bacterium]
MDLQPQIEAKGKEIFNSLGGGDGQSIFNKDWWYGKIMDWSMQNPAFKTQMFRFVDVLPTLQSSGEVAKHLKEYFAEGGEQLPSVFNFGLGLGSLAPGLMAGAIKKNVTQMAKMFITGESPKDAIDVLKKSRKQKMTFTIDILGEACLSETEALDYQNRYLELIDWLNKETKNWDFDPQLDTDAYGNIPRVNVSVKITALYSQIHPESWQHSIDMVKERLRPVLKKAMDNNTFINIDMEKFAIKDLTIETFKQLLMEDSFKNYPHFGIVIQAYLRDSFQDVKDLTAFAKQRRTPFSIRLVKGAYWDYETVGAQQKDWPIPVYTRKPESDINYEECTKYLLDNTDFIRLAIGSHNVRSIAFAMAYAEQKGLPKNAFELQMLYGMAEPFKKAIVSKGYRLREYCPVGEMLPGMSYLVRRLLENTSNDSFLKSKFADNTSDADLLADPRKTLQNVKDINIKERFFTNESPMDFSKKTDREKVTTALKQFKTSQLNKKWPAYISGEWVATNEYLESHNPSTEETLGHIAMCTSDMAESAMNAANSAFPAWCKTPAPERAGYLDKAADILERDRDQIIACQILEAGKTWKEADGDVAEAIDFLRYYAKQMRLMDKPRRVGGVPGEVSLYTYQGRGVNVVIAPWNFPLAILTGMVGASLVTGNTVVMKPAEQTSMTATFLMKAFIEAGLPKNVLHMVLGKGEVVGEHLVSHAYTAMICFTGSKDVGLRILQKASIPQLGQKHIKRTITELGGKNAIIVDSDADLDEAVTGVLYSAFGFQGQKCSACSRVIVLEDTYDRFLERLIESARSIAMGHSEDPHTFMGPVIDKDAKEKILKYVEIGKGEGATLAFQGIVNESRGYFVPPTIFTDVEPRSRLAQEEIFGPVLAVIKAKTLADALAIANDTDFALTGAFYSRSPANIEVVKKEFNVGNLYINRGSTGALVDRHPFGGFKLSGGGSKTGGPDYLIQFMDPKVTSENTMRRGFAPEE